MLSAKPKNATPPLLNEEMTLNRRVSLWLPANHQKDRFRPLHDNKAGCHGLKSVEKNILRISHENNTIQ